MTTVAIVAEYNPFHNGHKYQIDCIRRHFGADTRIIAIMSGNFTQRGELAIMDKGERAKNAVDCGINLVLELPFPFSMSSAEFFAKAAVSIIDRLGIVDYLAFGSEDGNTERLLSYARNTTNEKYLSTLTSLINKEGSIGYPALCEKAYNDTYGNTEGSVSLTPNNILALEYIKALIKLNSKIEPITFKRTGAGYNQQIDTASGYQSATGIRTSFLGEDFSALEYVPETTKQSIISAKAAGAFPVTSYALSSAIIASIRLNSPSEMTDIHDVGGGLYNRLYASAIEANDLDTLISLTETKKYTTARIRRAIWYSFLGVTSSDVKEIPEYTQILAMDSDGRTMLKEIGKCSPLPVLTKPSKTGNLSVAGLRQKSLSDRADSIFELCKPKPSSGNIALRFTPYVKK